jgi:F420-dependent oxidoreductase-like protein
MRFGINGSALLLAPDLAAITDHARDAASAGFASYWISQVGLVDAIAVLGCVGERVSGIEVGAAVIPTYSRHPASLAGQALTAQALCAGRLTLGIGVSHQPVIEQTMLMPWQPPVRHLREYLDVLQPLIENGSANAVGRYFSFAANLPRPDVPPPSILLAALGPQMLRLAGSHTDGTVLWLTGEKVLRDRVVPIISDAAERAGRRAPRIVCMLPVCVTDDPAAARSDISLIFDDYREYPSYRSVLAAAGADDPGGVALAGTEDKVLGQLQAIAAAGATDFVAVELGRTPDERDRTRDLLCRARERLR